MCFPQICGGHPRRVCAYPPSKTAVAPIHFVQLVIYFVQLDTNCHPLSWCIQKHHSQRTFTYCCEGEQLDFCILLFSSELLEYCHHTVRLYETHSIGQNDNQIIGIQSHPIARIAPCCYIHLKWRF